MELNNEALFADLPRTDSSVAPVASVQGLIAAQPAWCPLGNSRGDFWWAERWLLRRYEARHARMYDRVQADLLEMEGWLTAWMARDYLAEAVAARAEVERSLMTPSVLVPPPAAPKKRGSSGKIHPTIPVPPPPERPTVVEKATLLTNWKHNDEMSRRMSEDVARRMEAEKVDKAPLSFTWESYFLTCHDEQDEAFLRGVDTIIGVDSTHREVARRAAAQIVARLADNQLTPTHAARVIAKAGPNLVTMREVHQMMKAARAGRLAADLVIAPQYTESDLADWVHKISPFELSKPETMTYLRQKFSGFTATRISQVVEAEKQWRVREQKLLREQRHREERRREAAEERWEDFFDGKGSDTALAEPFNPNNQAAE